MSNTTAVYTFVGETGEYHVYRSTAGGPAEASRALAEALLLAHPLPRYDASEMAAAFVSTNKTRAGGIHLLPTGDVASVAPVDTDYHYLIMQARNGQLILKAHVTDNGKGWMALEFYYGRLVDFLKAHNEGAYALYRSMYPSKTEKQAA